MGVEHHISLARDGRAFYVYDSEGISSDVFGKAQSLERVSRFARLRYYYNKVFIAEYRIAVSEFARYVYRYGHARELFYNVFAYQSRVHCRSAGYYENVLIARKLLQRHSALAEVGHTLVYARGDGGLYSGRLVVYLFEHKVRVAALFSRFHIPVGGH